MMLFLRHRRIPHVLALPIVVASLLAGCSGSTALQSTALDREITVDGTIDDWQGILAPMEKHDVSLGLLNDGTHLYLALVSNDRQVLNQMITRGFTAWFDPAGGKEKGFGIRFPLGLLATGAGFSPRNQEPDPETRRQRFEASLTDLEIFDGEEKSSRFPVNAVQGIAADATLENGMLVYELQVPLRPSEAHAFAIGAAPGDVIGVGLETPEIDREALREQFGRRGGGGRGGRGGQGGLGGRGGGFGGRGGRPPQQADPLKIWTTVTLAATE